MTDSVSITQLFRARNHLLDILDEAGYDVSDYNNCSLSQIIAMNETNQLDLLLTHKSKTKKIFIKYNLEKKLNLNQICPFFDDVNKKILEKHDDLMVIVSADPTDSMIAGLDALWNDSSIYVSVINIARLQFNILKHTQVPKHTLLSPEETGDLFQKQHIHTVADLPTISRYDPVATVLCMRPGTVCHISRKSKTAVITDYYRACI